ncbi:MAG: D-mannonate oxidoreductase [uncultured Acidimicrobiales bacterium]|uniref:Mannitol-1-phosphate 5-dehydrogenase n=1 Tax=uncultured Acidimicrobiales bacterium TaxID=310071 RepID=A0A6J4HXD6_9ACTN|nr:MAG: D-mannonate oxidoreductase [uncultured Acidimicrobiales bacterium]
MNATLDLNDRTLPRLAACATVPTYDRGRLAPGVVHLSVGSFHRAHQAVYFEEIAQQGLDEGWGITGVGLRRREMKAALDAQDGLYTVVTRSARGDEARIVGVITSYLFAPEERAAVLDALADVRTRLVTLTITAAGYKVHPDTGEFLSEDDAVVEDLASPAEPGTALGLLVEALDRRRRAGLPPFTVLSCDNMADNGAIVGSSVAAFASLRDERLGRWIEENVAFPSSMVDRITPGTTDADREMVERTFGIRDRWPVMTEPFSQWVVEDRFGQGRPPLDEVGVQFVDDVRPYALTKTRLLNASHSALGYLGSLAGYERMDEVMADPVFAGYIEEMMTEEISPLLPSTGIDLATYGATLRRRFANPAVADRLSRLCRSGSTKVPAHLVSSLREALEANRPHALLTLAIAGWCRYLRAVDAHGRPFPLDDANGDRLRALAVADGGDPRRLLADEATFGSLGSCTQFVEAVERDLRQLEVMGPRAVIAARIADDEQLLAS